MTLKALYAKKEEIPTEFTSLYEEKDGKFVLTGIEGIKTQEDIDKVMQAKQHEVENRKRFETELAELKQRFDGIDPDKARDMLKKQDEAKLKQENPNVDLDKVRLEQDYKTTLEKLEQANQQIASYESEKKLSKIKEALIKTAREHNFDPRFDEEVTLRSGIFDIAESGEILTKDGEKPSEFLSRFADKYTLPSSGVGAKTPSGKPVATPEASKQYQEAKQKGDIKAMLLHSPAVAET